MGVVRERADRRARHLRRPRRTRIIDAQLRADDARPGPEEDQVVTLSHAGYIKRCRLDEWRTQRRGGHRQAGMSTRAEDFVATLFIANTHSMLLVFTDQGKVYPLHVYEVPEGARDARGRPIINLVPVPDDERVTAVVSVRDRVRRPATCCSSAAQGLVKRTPMEAFRNLRAGGMRAASVADDDVLLIVRLIEGPGHVMLFSRGGKCIRFPLDEVPEYGRTARGNLGINLAEGDVIVDAVFAPADVAAEEGAGEEEEEAPSELPDGEPVAEPDDAWETTLLTITENGYGSRTPFVAYRLQGRNGKGIISFRTGPITGAVVGAVRVHADDQLMLVTDSGRVIRIAADSVPITLSRAVKGVRLMRLEEGEKLVDIARLEEPVEVEGVVAAPQPDETHGLDDEGIEPDGDSIDDDDDSSDD
jgi:DNA gyrase subunit A